MNKPKMPIIGAVLLAILLLPGLAVQASGTSFDGPSNLGAGFNPNVQSVGNHVYVAWTNNNNGILFRASTDSGHTWGSVKKVGSGGQYPIMSANGNHVYIVWSSGGINFVNSSDNGATWSKPVKLSPSGGVTPFIASNGALVSVVYVQSQTGTSYVTSSADSGRTWTKPFQFSNGPEPQVAISGSNIYVTSDNIDKSHVQFAVSLDSGKSWTISSLQGGSEPWIVASGPYVYAVWETKTSSSVVWFLSSPDNGVTLNTKIISTGMPDSWNPMIQAAGQTVWVGIQELGGKAQNWMLTSTNAGGTWKSKSLTGLGHVDGFIFSIATTDATNVFAMWLQQSGSTWVVFVAYSSDGGGTWSVVNIGQSDPNNDVAIGSISSNGLDGLAAWQHNSAIWFSYS